MFDPTVNLGSILTIGAFIVFITIYVSNGKTATKVLDTRLETIDAQMEDFKLEMKQLAAIIIKQTEHTGRMDRMEDRQLAEGKRIDSISQAVRELLGPGQSLTR